MDSVTNSQTVRFTQSDPFSQGPLIRSRCVVEQEKVALRIDHVCHKILGHELRKIWMSKSAEDK
jgi:hypothetical protein